MAAVKTENLIDYIKETSGQDVLACYHCRKCTAGCPVTQFMDITPNAVHRMIQFGQKKELLQSNSIWLCAACETCGARCPNDIDIAKVMDAFKQMAIREGVRGKEKKIPVMHQVFLSGIQKRGRMHELSLMRDMRIRTGGYFKDWQLGLKMFKLGKLSIFPESVKNKKEVRRIFKKSKRIS